MDSSQPPSGQLHLLFIRHGETEDNINRILQGQRNTSLTKKGHKDAQLVGEKLQKQHIDAVYHSSLDRMVQTIQPTLSYHPDASVYPDPELMGQALGQLEGGSYDTIDMGNPRSADGQSGVELFDDFVRRLQRAMARIIGFEAPRVEQSDRTVVVATHGVCITSIFKTLESTPSCDGFNPQLATRGPDAFEVRWTDADDVAELIVPEPAKLPVQDGAVDWTSIAGKPFLIERWGKKEKAL